MLRSHIQVQIQEEVERVSHLRASTSSKRIKSSEVMDFLDGSYSLYSKLQNKVNAHRSIPTEHSVARVVKVTDLQRERNWSKDRVPVPLQYQLCVMCGHKSTNFPLENDTIEKHNEAVERNFRKNLSEWESYKRKIANGENATKPKGIPRRPVLKGLKEPILMCMCYAAHCLGQFDQAATKCPIKCLKDNTQPTALATNSSDDESEKKIESERYEFIGHPKKSVLAPFAIANVHMRAM